ncbi:hypothetical protein NC652_032273 [Populus alba x Populus x berolinensis]|uniref:Uncharacterized protein n=1 Tax=Populus tomentosa TaxID=118781 RepID=A0A8X7YG80_POPTO|nr:hypothetical protein POTOM_046094 [Populus tomentosa]KAJ6878683.1 hypothetical protein NC652_032273 [Populus alba x Populus x berolinensis]
MEISMTKGSSMKSLWFALGLMLLVVSTEMRVVHCRALRSASSTITTTGYQQVDGAQESKGAVASFVVSSKNSSGRPSLRSLMFKLASGPSKRGPGH